MFGQLDEKSILKDHFAKAFYRLRGRVGPNMWKPQNRGTSIFSVMAHENVTKVRSVSAPTGIQHVTPIWAGTEAHPTLKNTTIGSMRAIASQP